MYRVSQYALVIINQEARKLRSETNLPACTGSISAIFGLPCAHRIAGYIATSSPIPLEAVNRQWHLQLANEQLEGPIREPAVLRARGRPPSATTARNASLFEVVDAMTAPPATPPAAPVARRPRTIVTLGKSLFKVPVVVGFERGQHIRHGRVKALG